MTVKHTIICDHCGYEIEGLPVRAKNGVLASGASYSYKDNDTYNDYHTDCYDEIAKVHAAVAKTD